MQIITTHKNVDFDAVASLVAAKIIYPDAVAVLPGSVNPNVKGFLSIHKDLFNLHDRKEIDLSEVTSLIVVDTNSWSRLDGMRELEKREDFEVILWDHHPEKDIQTPFKVQEPKGANITLMIRELSRERKLLTPMQSTLFLCGLYEDTGNLSFPSATGEDAYAAGYLLDRKADLKILNSFLRPAYGEPQKDVLFQMVKNASTGKIKGHKISFSTVEVEGYISGLSVVVNMYRQILNVDGAIGIFVDREKDKCMVIGRSNVDDLNIGTIMNSLGGGGHPAAASALMKGVNPEVIEPMIRGLIEGNQKSSIQLSDLMSHPVISVDSHVPMEEVAQILRDKGCTGLPVVEEGRLVGVISRRDFKKVRKSKQMQAPVKAFMMRNVITIEPGKSPHEAARMMISDDIGRIPVVEEGKMIGIVTRTDVMTYFYDLLPD